MASPVEIVPEFRSWDEFLLEYEILEPLGSGTFGDVIAGVRRHDGLPVAIKKVAWVSLTSWDGTETAGPIPSELYLLQKASDIPGVVRLIDFCTDEVGLVLVMEYDKNASTIFSHLEKNGVFEEAEAARILTQLIQTLLSCQNKQIFHRDVKFDNVLYNSATEKVTLIDFGCGRMVNSPSQTFTDFAGTLTFFPPEYFITGSYSVEPTTVWSVGCLAFCMIFGHLPFSKRCDIIGNRLYFGQRRISYDASAFIRTCLHPLPRSRLRMSTLLDHPWLTQQDKGNNKQIFKTSTQGDCVEQRKLKNNVYLTPSAFKEILEDVKRKLKAGENITGNTENVPHESVETPNDDGTPESQTTTRGMKRSHDNHNPASSETVQSKMRRNK